MPRSTLCVCERIMFLIGYELKDRGSHAEILKIKILNDECLGISERYLLCVLL